MKNSMEELSPEQAAVGLAEYIDKIEVREYARGFADGYSEGCADTKEEVNNK